MRNFWDRPLGSKLILLLSVAFLVETLAPWQRVCAVTSEAGDRVCGWRTAYEGTEFGTYAAILAGRDPRLGAAPRVAPRLSMRGWPAAIVTAILAVALALVTLVKVIGDNEFQTVWAWVGLALALAVMFVALIRVRYRWGHAAATDRRTRRQPRGAVRRRSATRETREPPQRLTSRYPWWTTYGGDQVSTWSVLRSSSEPRSPVGLVKQPAHKASAKHDLALAA